MDLLCAITTEIIAPQSLNHMVIHQMKGLLYCEWIVYNPMIINKIFNLCNYNYIDLITKIGKNPIYN